MQFIRILLVNHHPIIRSSLRRVVEADSQIQVVAEAANGWEAVLLSQYQKPDVVLLDFQLPVLSGISTAREIRAWHPAVGILFVSVLADKEYVLEAFHAGADGFVLENAAHTDLLRAIRVVAEGRKFLSPLVSAELVDDCNRRSGGRGLSLLKREKELFCWFAEGLDDGDIADRLNLTKASIRAVSEDVRRRLEAIGMSLEITSLLQKQHFPLEPTATPECSE